MSRIFNQILVYTVETYFLKAFVREGITFSSYVVGVFFTVSAGFLKIHNLFCISTMVSMFPIDVSIATSLVLSTYLYGWIKCAI